MPHFITNRPRKFAVWQDSGVLKSHFRWEYVNVVVYAVGGLIFVLGSVFFLPELTDLIEVGAWHFVVGSFLYLIVSSHDFVEFLHYENKKSILDATAAITYILGSLLFIVGSILFLPQVEEQIAGAWCFITGSAVFVVGAILNAMQVFEFSTVWTQRYMNLTAACYMIGSTLFASASVPYLFSFDDAGDKLTLDRYLGYQYILGSLFFLLGGLLNGLRAYLLQTGETKKQEDQVHYASQTADEHNKRNRANEA
jgi:hypothetical protein